MEYPGNPLKLSVNDILNHYKRRGMKPAKRGVMNAILREQYLCLKETNAFYIDSLARGYVDPEMQQDLEIAQQAYERIVLKLDSHSYT